MTKDRYPTPKDEAPLREKPIEEVAAVLQEVLGQKMVAYAIGEPHPKHVGVFARGEDTPDEEGERVMRDMAEVTEALSKRGVVEAAYMVMLSENPVLDDQVPIILIHNGESERVAAAADQLLESDYR